MGSHGEPSKDKCKRSTQLGGAEPTRAGTGNAEPFSSAARPSPLSLQTNRATTIPCKIIKELGRERLPGARQL